MELSKAQGRSNLGINPDVLDKWGLTVRIYTRMRFYALAQEATIIILASLLSDTKSTGFFCSLIPRTRADEEGHVYLKRNRLEIRRRGRGEGGGRMEKRRCHVDPKIFDASWRSRKKYLMSFLVVSFFILDDFPVGPPSLSVRFVFR